MDIDKSNPSTEFVDFVRSAFSQLNLKMDNFMASQLTIERETPINRCTGANQCGGYWTSETINRIRVGKDH